MMPSQGPSSRLGNSVDGLLAFPTSKWVSEMASSGPLPTVFTVELPAKPPWAVFPPVHSSSHTTNTQSFFFNLNSFRVNISPT
jgi:hypothetical protein